MIKTAPPPIVLISCGGSFSGQSLVDALREIQGVRILIADVFSESPVRHSVDAYFQVPLISSSEMYIAALLEIAIANHVNLLIPATYYDLTLLASRREAFEAHGVRLAVSEEQILKKILNRQTMRSTFREAGFEVAEHLDLTSAAPQFPILLKPVTGWGGKGQQKIDGAADLASFFRVNSQAEFVAEPYFASFSEYSVDFAVDFAASPSPVIVRERLRTVCGFAVVSEVTQDPELNALGLRAARFLAGCGGRGFFNIQIMRAEGRCWISDVNPRVGTSSTLSDSVGANLARILYQSIFDVSGDQAAVPHPIKIVRTLQTRYYPTVPSGAIKGIVFDLDDTLINQKQWVLGKLELLWLKHSTNLPARENFLYLALRLFEEGMRSNLIDEIAKAIEISSELVPQLINDYREFIPGARCDYPETIPVLRELRRRGYKLAILSDNPPSSQQQKIQAHDLAIYFDTVVFSQEVGDEKPAPTGFAAVEERLGCSQTDLCMVGDNLHRDLFGALQAGFRKGFWIRRDGQCLSQDMKLFSTLTAVAHDVVTLSSLRDIFWSLPTDSMNDPPESNPRSFQRKQP